MKVKQTSVFPTMLTALIACVTGCSGLILEREDASKVDLGVAPREGAWAKTAAYRDTIGSLAFYEGMGPMVVRGYGLMVGLGKNGSRDCPKHIYEPLVQKLHKLHRFSSGAVGVTSITPEQMIDDTDTAVVVVRGEIVPASVVGARFDVTVAAVPGTQTRSLRGGRLFTTELQMFRPVTPEKSLVGQALARAAGPVFINPFSDGESATKSNPLQGTITGGGLVTKDRRIRLVLTHPSYVQARRIEGRINSHFPSPYRIADAISPSFIRLRIPREFKDDTAHFLALVLALYVSQDPQFEATRARQLGQDVLHPEAQHAKIALCFEGLGRAGLSLLSELYSHPRDYVSFHTAVAGLRLGDHLAGDTLATIARDPGSVFRYQAIRALAGAKGMAGAAIALRHLLNDADPRIQVAAYEGLVDRGDVTVESKPIGGDNFILDRVPTYQPGFIYVKRSGLRRIALFGRQLRCVPPVLYRAPDGSVTITADYGASSLTLLRQVVSTGTVSPPIAAPLELPALIEFMGADADADYDNKVLGLGLDYGAIMRALYRLSTDGAINAKFILEQPNAAEMFGPSGPVGRPESEL